MNQIYKNHTLDQIFNGKVTKTKSKGATFMGRGLLDKSNGEIDDKFTEKDNIGRELFNILQLEKNRNYLLKDPHFATQVAGLSDRYHRHNIDSENLNLTDAISYDAKIANKLLKKKT